MIHFFLFWHRLHCNLWHQLYYLVSNNNISRCCSVYIFSDWGSFRASLPASFQWLMNKIHLLLHSDLVWASRQRNSIKLEMHFVLAWSLGIILNSDGAIGGGLKANFRLAWSFHGALKATWTRDNDNILKLKSLYSVMPPSIYSFYDKNTFNENKYYLHLNREHDAELTRSSDT